MFLTALSVQIRQRQSFAISGSLSGRYPLRPNIVDATIEKLGLKQISDTVAIEKMIEEILTANAAQVIEYHAGKEKAFNFLVGQAMKATRGKANPTQVNEILKRKLAG